MYDSLKKAGYFLEILGGDFTCFDAEQYGALLMVDMEEEYYPDELEKLTKDVKEKGLGLVVFGDWYNSDLLHIPWEYGENTREFWTPATGGANVPALNDLLRPFGISFGDKVFSGEVSDDEGKNTVRFLSGNALRSFPTGGFVKTVSMQDQGKKNVRQGFGDQTISLLLVWLIGTKSIKVLTVKVERIAVYGDSNCIDSNNARGRSCFLVAGNIFEVYNGEPIRGEIAEHGDGIEKRFARQTRRYRTKAKA